MMPLRSLAAIGLLLPGVSSAAGLYLYELGTDDVGLASAGMAARAQDASTIASNPAGMTRLAGDDVTLGLQALYGDTHYQMANDHLNSPDDSIIGWFPAGSAFYSHSLDDRWKLGIGLYGNFGLSLDFGDWSGNDILKDCTLMAMSLQPSVAYRLNDAWSLGVGINANYGIFSIKGALDDGLDISDTDWAAGYKLGLLYQPNADLRLGLAYSSRVTYRFSQDGLGEVIQALPLSGKVVAPQQLMLSGVYSLSPRVDLLANLGWQDWSVYNKNEVWIGEYSKPSANLLQDTWHAALGIQNHMAPRLTMNLGVAFDSSIYKDQDNALLALPSGDTVRLGVGGRYTFDDRNSLGIALELAQVDGSTVQGNLLGGHYNPSTLYFIAISYGHKS
ncbi:OmpP1/FadL family transporter [Pseudaeromonas paramecii]|uniref:Outer membrane protein transport protein n=1 Tax=Pseudaeromonas paramecii TaxID=2138166 RepID=A0ABP8Q2U2_9GAMM